jgi:hypothetical protein
MSKPETTKRKKEPLWETHVYLGEEMYEKLVKLAAKNERSMTKQIKWMLAQAMEAL